MKLPNTSVKGVRTPRRHRTRLFEYAYDEIAGMLEKSEGACRQLFSRAKDRIIANRPRFQVSPEEHRRLLEEFMRAAVNGDLHNLTNLLAEDATIWADGG